MTTPKNHAASKKSKASEPTPEPKTTKSTAVGGLTELQAQVDADTARGFKGPKEES